ncbi:MAG: ATP-binding protein [Xenococcaceae cyanobacterium MO_188.B29]|nr:ATP-binding protein [Xenococcaceae cyanobacterium MO_188.B29]
MLCAEELLRLELFQHLPKARIDWICDRATPIDLAKGEILIKEGDPPRGFFVILAGSLSISRLSNGIEMPIGQHEAPAFVGEIPVLTEQPILVTLCALTDCRVYEIAGEDFLELLHECRDFERTIFRTVQTRIRGLESFIRNREKMAALGNLAAGLAHELNNPAAALVRALKDVTPALLELQRMNLVYGKAMATEEDPTHTQEWQDLRDRGYDIIIEGRLDSLTISDREEELLDWLEDYGVEQAWKLAEPLASGNVTPEILDILMERWRDDTTELRDQGIRWLALSFDVMSSIQAGLRGAERISALISSMKSYSHLDRGVQQIVDVHDGIEDTIKLFSYKIKQGIEIKRNYDRKIPKVPAYGSELNQVWTNLIDNAIDAMDGEGKIEITTSSCKDRVIVTMSDSGSGIPDDVRSRIFEPFFTTKAVGKGSGLGLDIVRRVVENRHRGTISCDSKPGQTTFTIGLPVETESRN